MSSRVIAVVVVVDDEAVERRTPDVVAAFLAVGAVGVEREALCRAAKGREVQIDDSVDC